MKLRFLIILSFLFCILLSIGQNLNNMDVQNFSDEQVNQIVQEIQNRGLTLEQAIILARTRGASETQISQLRMRIQQLGTMTQKPQAITQDSTYMQQFQSEYSTKEELIATERNQKVFGFKLFNNENFNHKLH